MSTTVRLKWFCLALLVLFFALPAAADPLADKVKKSVGDAVEIRRKSQKDSEKWAAEKNRLEAEFDSLLEDQKRLDALVDRLEKQRDAKQHRVSSLEEQLASMEAVSNRIMPFLKTVAARIETLIETPPRFLTEERSARLDYLTKALDDPQPAPGETFRRVMDGLFEEVEYGNTVEVYREKIAVENDEVLVDVFRLGRTALFFQTLDQETCGYRDTAAGQWLRLPRKANRGVHAAMEIGAKRRPADIVSLPLGRIVTE